MPSSQPRPTQHPPVNCPKVGVPVTTREGMPVFNTPSRVRISKCVGTLQAHRPPVRRVIRSWALHPSDAPSRLHFHQDALFRQKSGLPDPTPPTTGPLPPLGPSVHADHSLPRRSGHRRVTAGLNGSVVCDGGGGCWPPRCFNASTLQLSRSLNAERAVA